VSYRFRLDAAVVDAPAISPDGRTVAGISRPDPTTADSRARAIVVGALPTTGAFDRGQVVLREVPGVRANVVLGWRDATHVVVLSHENLPQPRVDSVDLGTGAVEPLTVFAGQNWAPGKIVAAGAWSAPVVAAKEPRWPPDPRVVGGVVGLLAGLGAIGYARRRRSRARA